jgi:hypothetical protein
VQQYKGLAPSNVIKYCELTFKFKYPGKITGLADPYTSGLNETSNGLKYGSY